MGIAEPAGNGAVPLVVLDRVDRDRDRVLTRLQALVGTRGADVLADEDLVRLRRVAAEGRRVDLLLGLGGGVGVGDRLLGRDDLLGLCGGFLGGCLLGGLVRGGLLGGGLLGCARVFGRLVLVQGDFDLGDVDSFAFRRCVRSIRPCRSSDHQRGHQAEGRGEHGCARVASARLLLAELTQFTTRMGFHGVPPGWELRGWIYSVVGMMLRCIIEPVLEVQLQ